MPPTGCQFCGSPQVARVIDLPTFDVELPRVGHRHLGGPFPLCAACAGFVERGERQGLLDHVRLALHDRGAGIGRAANPALTLATKAVTDVWRLIEEQTLAAPAKPMTPALASRITQRLILNFSARENQRVTEADQVCHSLRDAQAVLWRKDLWDACQRSPGAFAGTTLSPDIAAAGPQFWFTTEPVREMDGRELRENLRVPPISRFVCFFLAPITGPFGAELQGGAIYAATAASAGDSLGRVSLASFHSQPATGLIEERFCPFAAALTFMAMEWVGAERHVHSVADRRYAEKRKLPLPEVRTISLRRAYSEQHPPGQGDGREWSCSWMVSGHWRRQWYPGSGEWKPKWINPYVKGDLDKPLKDGGPAVYVVRR